MPLDARRVATLAAGALALLHALWHGWLAPPAAGSNALVAAWMAAPAAALALLLPRAARAAFAAAGLVALLYLSHGLMELVANPAARGLALIECASALALLGAAAHALRRIAASR